MFTLFSTTKNLILFIFILTIGNKVTGQISITSLGVANSQNFDGLNNTGTASIISNWEVSEPLLDGASDAGDGTSTTAGLYSFGTGTNADRALGSLTSASVEPILIGAKFTNNTGQNISSISIQYSGEQWRLGSNALTDKLIFEYSTDAASVGSSSTWIPVTALDFTSPITTGTPGALDGNLTANRTTITANLAVNIPSTTGFIYIRWRDQQIGSDDHCLGIDDFTLTAYTNLTSGTYPEMMIDGTLTLAGDITITNTTNFINSSSKLDIGANTLTLSGNVSGTPIIIGGANANMVISGSGTIGTINFDQTTPGTSNLLKNLTINRSGVTVTLGNALNISDINGSINLTAGSLVTGGNLTLLSSASGTARIGEITSGVSDLTGNVTIQRHMQGAAIDYRGWRTMGPATSSYTAAQLTDDIFVTGPGGVTNGFDASGTNSSVMYYEEDFNASGGRGWKSISNTSTAFTAGQGMLVFFRGDRTQTASITNTSTVPNAVVMDEVGAINKGDVVVNLKYNDDSNIATEDGWNFISNPYPSQILWGNVSKGVSVDNNIAVLNPLTNGYVTLGPSDFIASNQGFFVKANATLQSITFQENDKVSNGTTPYFKTQINPFAIKMFEDSIKYDIALLKFETSATKNYVFKEDALKMANSRINIGYITPNGKTVQINTIPYLPANSTDTFILKTTSFKNGTHWLTFEDKSILPLSKNVILVDTYNNNIVDVKSSSTYVFTMDNSIVGTYGNRFKLIITDQFGILPVNLTSFSGEKSGKSNRLSWVTASEKNLVNFEVEKSVDGVKFETIALIKATNQSTSTKYGFVDNDADAAGNNYYRLRINETKGINSYTQVIVLHNIENSNIVFDIYPNPAQNLINIGLPNDFKINHLEIFDVNGKSVFSGDNPINIDVSALAPGLYTIQINTNYTSQKLKFIKQ
jgi:hypothetical protein